jgi:FtsP/CotA-like multicopper oxidase with cupredoxin domain
MSPDGVERLVMVVNGQMPGPPIKASWGDTVVVKVNNLLQNNGTSIHFHGIRQLNNNMNDGVPSITQCPIAPGESMTYTWVAENYGTSWYHSHFAIQAWEGVIGPMIIDGPHSADFDVDMGPIQIQDWSHFTVDSRYDLAQNATPIPGNTAGATFGGPVLLDTGLINGQNIWNGDDQNSTAIGERLQLTFEPGKTYLLRIINSAIQSSYKFYLDGHTFTVISTDFVPIVPYETNILNINIGQRYNVLVTANQAPGSYFLRADNQNACAGTVQALDIRAVVTYTNAPTGVLPTSSAYNYTTECVDEPLASLVPVVPLNVGAADFTEGALEVVIGGNAVNLYKWFLSGTTFQSQYGDPTLLDIYTNDTVPSYSGNLLIELPNNKEWVYVIVESPIPLPHPLHLHGKTYPFVLVLRDLLTTNRSRFLHLGRGCWII